MAFNGTGANVTTLNAENISSGTLAVARGGTGITSAGTAGNVLTSDGSVFVSQAISAGGDYVMQVYNSPATWTKPAGLKAVKVTVVGGGGGGGGCFTPSQNPARGGMGGGAGTSIEYLPTASLPGPVSVTTGAGGAAGPTTGNGGAGGTSSFGAFLSATGGTGGIVGVFTPSGGANFGAPGTGGAGSGGQLNMVGGTTTGPQGGASLYGFGAPLAATNSNGINGNLYGAGASGGSKQEGEPARSGGTGAAGVVIVEEFY